MKIQVWEAKAILDSVEKTHDAEISLLFEEARDKLDNIEKQAKEKKKQIVADLAEKLEGKIATDTISIEIVNQLRGQVHEGFVRECLPEKYKQKYRVKNARKQKRQLESKVNDKLAKVTTLNQDEEEEEEEEKKELIMVDVDGRTSTQKDEHEPPSTTTTDLDTTTTDMTFIIPIHLLQSQKQQDQEQKLKKPIDQNHELVECHSCQVLYDENLQLKETLKRSHQLITADKMLTEPHESTYDDHADTSNDILPFELSVPYKDTQRYMQELFQKTGGNGRVWISGKINTKTGMVTSSTLGRMNQQI